MKKYKKERKRSDARNSNQNGLMRQSIRALNLSFPYDLVIFVSKDFP
jgi:hypothetical protein